MVSSCRAGNRTSLKYFWSYFRFISYKSKQGSCSLVEQRNPHLPALSDSPIKFVASVLSVGGGKGGGDTTLLNIK